MSLMLILPHCHYFQPLVNYRIPRKIQNTKSRIFHFRFLPYLKATKKNYQPYMKSEFYINLNFFINSMSINHKYIYSFHTCTYHSSSQQTEIADRTKHSYYASPAVQELFRNYSLFFPKTFMFNQQTISLKNLYLLTLRQSQTNS